MSNLNRVLTIRVKITDPKAAEWLWDAHVNGPINGVIVEALADGDLFNTDNEDSVLVKKQFYIKEENETVEQAVAAHVYGGFTTVDEARSYVKETIYKNAVIIDQTGKVYE